MNPVCDAATPLVLMGYYNPIYVHGVDTFLADAKAAGVDGLIVVDLPPEEDGQLCLPALAAGVDFIRLATPTTDDKRLPAVLTNTSGFVYYVLITGITGAPRRPGNVAFAVARINAAPSCRSALALACARRNRRAALRKALTASSSARRWSRRYARALDLTPSCFRYRDSDHGLVGTLAEGVRSRARFALRWGRGKGQ